MEVQSSHLQPELASSCSFTNHNAILLLFSPLDRYIGSLQRGTVRSFYLETHIWRPQESPPFAEGQSIVNRVIPLSSTGTCLSPRSRIKSGARPICPCTPLTSAILPEQPIHESLFPVSSNFAMEAPAVPVHAMVVDDAADEIQQTQLEQATQPLSQDGMPVPPPDNHLWGFLIPCNPAMARIDLYRKYPVVKVGRNSSKDVGNHVVLPGLKISNKHCEIKWDENDSRKSIITVADLSSNGTFINGEKIGKGRHGILKEGAEIAFGSAVPQSPDLAQQDYRYVFRLLAGGPPPTGLHAHYSITHELGKGAFATVMKAMSKETGHFYAIKMIQSNKLRAALTHGGSFASDGDQKPKPTEQFAREISILERLKHPNICQLKEVFFEEANISLVLEWVPGGDLLDYIMRRNGLPEEEVRYLTYQICDAMAYIHEQGIAHRDLKPENILLTTDVPPRVKVADFGLAKAVDSYTMLRTMCGTPAYLAPEVVCQEEQVGYQSVVDSWSVGVVVFCMITNTSPFVDPTNITDVKLQIKFRIVEWSVLKGLKASTECEDFIRKLLERHPERRMTLTDARNHPWLRGLNPNPGAQDLSMRSPSRDDMSMDEDQPSSQPDESSLNEAGSQRTGGRLVRRRQVIDEAAEKGESLPEPSQEMLRHAEQENAKYYTGTKQSRPNKRKVGEHFDESLTPMPEANEEDDEEQEEDIDENMSILSPLPVNTRAKRAKAQTGGDVNMSPAKATKGRGGGRGGKGSTRGKQAHAGMSEVPEEEGSKPRRSSRISQTPQKALGN
ncbi:unnamed protein product [Somion occarium]|uniref:Pkinase-domain-containing protein n=2 Tax=Somion occarium TaxID=3059160 RepID=A0ABP1DH30_9APHY